MSSIKSAKTDADTPSDSLGDTFPNASSPTPPEQPEQIVHKYEPFYGAATNALWDLFVTGYLEPKHFKLFDMYMDTNSTSHLVSFCVGEFTTAPYGSEGFSKLTIDKDQWKQSLHERIAAYMDDLDDIIISRDIEGIELQDREDFFSIVVTKPHELLRLIETYLDRYDVVTLDDVCPEDLEARAKASDHPNPATLAKTLRQAATKAWGQKNYTVTSPKPIDIRYFPTTMSPTIDTADIALIDAQAIEDCAPFSIDLLRNTYKDCIGSYPSRGMGLALLH